MSCDKLYARISWSSMFWVFVLYLFCDYMIRKKKVTARWRKFVRPVMWRCKWVELQLRELQSQVSKYDRELAECDRKKHCELDRDPTEDLGIKSVPFISRNRSVKLMKRKKRKRVEETVDLASYTSSHSLFSYYGMNSFNLWNCSFVGISFWGICLIWQLSCSI